MLDKIAELRKQYEMLLERIKRDNQLLTERNIELEKEIKRLKEKA